MSTTETSATTSSSTTSSSSSTMTTSSSPAVDAPDHEHGIEPDAPLQKFCSQKFDTELLQQVMATRDDDDHDDDGNDDAVNGNGNAMDQETLQTSRQKQDGSTNNSSTPSSRSPRKSEPHQRQPPTPTINEEEEERTNENEDDDNDEEAEHDKRRQSRSGNDRGEHEEEKDNNHHEPQHEVDQSKMLSSKDNIIVETVDENNTDDLEGAVVDRKEHSTATKSVVVFEVRHGADVISDEAVPTMSPLPQRQQQKQKQKHDEDEDEDEQESEESEIQPNPFDQTSISIDQSLLENSNTQMSPEIDLGSKDVADWLGQLADETVHHHHHHRDNNQKVEGSNSQDIADTKTPGVHGVDSDPPAPPSVSELSTTSAAQRDAHLAGLVPPHEIVATNTSTMQDPASSTSTNLVSSAAAGTNNNVHPTSQQQIPSRHIELSPMEMEPTARLSVRSSVTGVGNNGHFSQSGYTLAHPEVGIPHMPPLMLPPQPLGQQHPRQQQFHQTSQYSVQPTLGHTPTSHVMIPSGGGKRRIHLRLVEENTSIVPHQPERSLFSSFRRKRPSIQSPIREAQPTSSRSQWVDRGTLTVSWYEGTSSTELQDHVRNSIVRKLGLDATTKLEDFRVLDESVDPPEEIVLCPFIPNESRLLLRFKKRDSGGDKTPVYGRSDSEFTGPPVSPSAAPSPHPKSEILHGLGLNANQLALLGSRLKGLQLAKPSDQSEGQGSKSAKGTGDEKKGVLKPSMHTKTNSSNHSASNGGINVQEKNPDDDDNSNGGSNMEVASLHPEDQIQKSLREITELLISERSDKTRQVPRQEKRQVIFVLANYFVLFLTLIAVSAEIQARAPEWHAAMERQLKNVQDCSKDKESLFQCVENGDMAGLVASVLLWVSRSAATKRIFLFGFESPKRLWTVVYESMVTAVFWGFSYMFIRRGMNPDTSHRFLQKYWKDAIYGSLAGFNAAFMKQVLKNLIPQEAIEDALQDRQFKFAFLSWLPSVE